MKVLILEKDIRSRVKQILKAELLEKEAPINASNVMILDPKSNEPTRIGSQIIFDEKTGKKKEQELVKSPEK